MIFHSYSARNVNSAEPPADNCQACSKLKVVTPRARSGNSETEDQNDLAAVKEYLFTLQLVRPL